MSTETEVTTQNIEAAASTPEALSEPVSVEPTKTEEVLKRHGFFVYSGDGGVFHIAEEQFHKLIAEIEALISKI